MLRGALGRRHSPVDVAAGHARVQASLGEGDELLGGVGPRVMRLDPASGVGPSVCERRGSCQRDWIASEVSPTPSARAKGGFAHPSQTVDRLAGGDDGHPHGGGFEQLVLDPAAAPHGHHHGRAAERLAAEVVNGPYELDAGQVGESAAPLRTRGPADEPAPGVGVALEQAGMSRRASQTAASTLGGKSSRPQNTSVCGSGVGSGFPGGSEDFTQRGRERVEVHAVADRRGPGAGRAGGQAEQAGVAGVDADDAEARIADRAERAFLHRQHGRIPHAAGPIPPRLTGHAREVEVRPLVRGVPEPREVRAEPKRSQHRRAEPVEGDDDAGAEPIDEFQHAGGFAGSTPRYAMSFRRRGDAGPAHARAISSRWREVASGQGCTACGASKRRIGSGLAGFVAVDAGDRHAVAAVAAGRGPSGCRGRGSPCPPARAGIG